MLDVLHGKGPVANDEIMLHFLQCVWYRTVRMLPMTSLAVPVATLLDSCAARDSLRRFDPDNMLSNRMKWGGLRHR